MQFHVRTPFHPTGATYTVSTRKQAKKFREGRTLRVESHVF